MILRRRLTWGAQPCVLTMLSDVEFLEDYGRYLDYDKAGGTPCSYLTPTRASTTCEVMISCLLSYGLKGHGPIAALL